MSENPASPNPYRAPRDFTWLGVVVLVLMLGASILLINKADAVKTRDWNDDRLTYLPSGKMIKPLAMDLDEAVAALLWIRAMVYFSDSYLAGKGYGWLGHMLDIITILNPYLYQAYEFGGVVLTKEKRQLPKTMVLLERGIATYPKEWRLRLYASMAQLALDSNFIKAAEFLKPVTLDKDVPDHIRTMCATLLNKGGGRRMALAFLVDRYRNSDNAINREIFVEKIIKLYPAGSEPDAKRKEVVKRVLTEVSYEPMIEMMALGVINEYLLDIMSPQTRELVQKLFP